MKEIEGYKGYIIYNDGKIYSKISGKFLKHYKSVWGYMSVSILVNSVNKLVKVHRLVATAFIPNLENKKEVNHKNGIKDDNRVDNLEWVTPSENRKHAYDTGLKKAPLSIEGWKKKVIDNSNGKIYSSIIQASKELDIERCGLSRMLNGKRKNTTSLSYI